MDLWLKAILNCIWIQLLSPLYFLGLLNESSIFVHYVTTRRPGFVQICQRSNEIFDQQTLRQRINFQLTWKLSNVRMIIRGFRVSSTTKVVSRINALLIPVSKRQNVRQPAPISWKPMGAKSRDKRTWFRELSEESHKPGDPRNYEIIPSDSLFQFPRSGEIARRLEQSKLNKGGIC